MAREISQLRDLTDEGYWEGLSSRALSRFFLLASLGDGPKHGYELKRSISECCGGCCNPSDAMIYPAIKELAAGGYIECVEQPVDGRTRQVCHLTGRGIEALAAGARAWRRVLPSIERIVAQSSESSTAGLLEARE